MGKRKDGSSDSSVPGDSPISSVLDQFSGLNGAEGDFEISKFLDFRVVVRGRELSTEDCVEVDGSPRYDVLPLRVGELWTVWLIDEGSLRCFRVDCVDLNELERFCKGVS